MRHSPPAVLLTWLVLLCSLSAAQDFSCSPDKPWSIGCCGNSNVCGLGPTFCGPGNCTSSCDQKSDCDPGWGAEWSSAEKCPLNVCCSKFGMACSPCLHLISDLVIGFCGTTSEFCGTQTVTEPSCSGGSLSNQRTIGYYEGWDISRTCDQTYPENLPIGAYAHLNFHCIQTPP
jgi:chitinase